jgi:hypothetical protein
MFREIKDCPALKRHNFATSIRRMTTSSSWQKGKVIVRLFQSAGVSSAIHLHVEETLARFHGSNVSHGSIVGGMECKNMAEMASCERFSKNERGDLLTLEFIRFVGKVNSEMRHVLWQCSTTSDPVPDLQSICVIFAEDDTT